jgi:hypothetical protein
MTDLPERRRAPRRDAVDDHGIVSTRIRPGHDVALVNVSAGGALIETGRRLMPGAPIELQLATSQERAALRGRVVRCSVCRLQPADISYRGAISFDRPVPWFAHDPDGYAVPGAEIRPHWPLRANPTPTVL